MAQVVPYLATLRVRLFANNYFPRPQDGSSFYTEPTFDTYASHPLSSWSAVYLNTRFEAQSDAPLQSWTVGPGGGHDLIYGFWLTDSAGRVILAERDPRGGQPMDVVGATYAFLPHVALGPLLHPNVYTFRHGLAVGGHFGP
jgi:hypothetical protein